MLRHVWEGIQAAPGVLQRDLHREGPLRVRVPEHGQLSWHAAAQHPALLPRGVPCLGVLARRQLGKRKFGKLHFFTEKIGKKLLFFTQGAQCQGLEGKHLRGA